MPRSTLIRALWGLLAVGLIGGGFWLFRWVSAADQAFQAQAPATPAYLPGTPAALLADYVAGDFAGERLEGANWLKYKRMVIWPTEPSWESAYVVRSYRLQPAQTTPRQAMVEVTYHTLGELNVHSFTYTPSPTRHTVAFTLVPRQGEWKIGHPILRPHVSPEAAIAHMERMATLYPQRRADIQRAIAAVRADARQPGGR